MKHLSNPLLNIDPRAVTAVYPIFGSSWVSSGAPIPDSDVQVYAAAITVALSDRFAMGLNQGGYRSWMNIPRRLFPTPGIHRSNREFVVSSRPSGRTGRTSEKSNDLLTQFPHGGPDGRCGVW
jgi:hypothetical protein